MGKPKETVSFKEVDPSHVAEFIAMGENARSPKDRGSWLRALSHYRFTRATKKQRRRLATIADVFRRVGVT